LTHPDPVSHASLVHGLPSLQFSAGPPAHAPPEQASPVVQALPSLHGWVLLMNSHPVAGLQVSLVQALPSMQGNGAPPTQVPDAQVSPVVQASPSLHGNVFGAFWHPRKI